MRRTIILISLVIALLFLFGCGAKPTEPTPLPRGPVKSSASTEECVRLSIRVENGKFTFLEGNYIPEPGPNYLDEKKEFTARVLSSDGTVLGEYAVGDPRVILAEPGYTGPTYLDSTEFELILPYSNGGAKMELVENKTGKTVLEVDISKYHP